jgi:hypothetical protein
MKIRSGFVSNSSSTSFLIYGIRKDVSEDEEDALRDAGFLVRLGPDDYTHEKYIGLSWDKVKDSETGEQFKLRIEHQLKKILGSSIKCQTHSASWYNG